VALSFGPHDPFGNQPQTIDVSNAAAAVLLDHNWHKKVTLSEPAQQ
jgi:hypothetical protein